MQDPKIWQPANLWGAQLIGLGTTIGAFADIGDNVVIGQNCKIHPTAVLESCIIGNNVEIGPHCYLRGVVVGDQVMIRENSSIKVAVIGRGSFIVPSDIFNCFIGENSNIVTHILYNCVIGSNTFLGGGVGFADLKFNAEPLFNDDQIFLAVS